MKQTLEGQFGRYRAVLCGSTLVMVGLSWPLWVDRPDFPMVPFFEVWPEPPAWISWVVLVGIVASLGMATVGRGWRPLIRLSLPLLAFAILGDQNRLQPWAYQYLLIGLTLAMLSKARALRLARWYAIGVYVYSGLSKLDASFLGEMGPTFLSAALGPFGVSPSNWPAVVRMLAILAMPAFEIAVGALLAVPSTRRAGLVGSIALHSSLLMILGPWGLDQSTIVLVWNGSLIVENLILFGPNELPAEFEAESRLGPVALMIFGASLIVPAGERLGLCDAWPAHALYASHCERTEVYLHEDDLDRYPEAVLRRLGPAGFGPWRRLDLTGWSRDLRGTPIYPSGRVGNAVAESLEVRFGGLQPVRVVQWGRASILNGRRDRDESLGLRAIRSRADRFLLNAHPAVMARSRPKDAGRIFRPGARFAGR